MHLSSAAQSALYSRANPPTSKRGTSNLAVRGCGMWASAAAALAAEQQLMEGGG